MRAATPVESVVPSTSRIAPFGNGTTQIVDSAGNVVGYIFAEWTGELGGIERAVLYEAYVPPPTEQNNYRLPPPEHRYETLEAWHKAISPGDASIWRTGATYVKVNLRSYPEGPPPGEPEPPPFPLPPPVDVDAPQQVDYGTSELFDARDPIAGAAGYVFGTPRDGGQTHEYWYANRRYQAPPEGDVTIGAPTSPLRFGTPEELMEYVRGRWRDGDAFVVASVSYYLGYVPEQGAPALPASDPRAGV